MATIIPDTQEVYENPNNYVRKNGNVELDSSNIVHSVSSQDMYSDDSDAKNAHNENTCTETVVLTQPKIMITSIHLLTPIASENSEYTEGQRASSQLDGEECPATDDDAAKEDTHTSIHILSYISEKNILYYRFV